MDSNGEEHIVMVPLMAHGHIIPFLSLAKQIQQSTGYRVTIANTPLNIHYLRSTTNPSSSSIHFVELPFCGTEHGLPPNTENTENLPLHQLANLFHSSASLETPFYNLLLDIKQKEGKPPLCIIADVFCGWAVRVAKMVGTINVSFSTGGAYGTLGYTSMWLNLPHRNKTDSDVFNLPGFPDRCVFHVKQLHRFLRLADGTDAWSRFFQPQISQSMESYAMLCNTVEEIEPQALQWLRNFTKIPVWPIGPLLPQAFLFKKSSSDNNKSITHSGKVPAISPERCLEWLDSHDPASVLYISFGSQNTITPSQMMELAMGLEQSAKPFIWVIRPPIGFDLKGEFRSEWLPEGFQERTTKQGLLVKNWAPQLDILSHKSTGAFLSHCGWNSVMESLSQGVPIIGWPMAAEQSYNSKMLVEEMGVSVQLTRGVDSIVGEQVKKVIELVMDKTGKGEEMRGKAAEIANQIRASMKENGSSLKSLDGLFKSIKLYYADKSN